MHTSTFGQVALRDFSLSESSSRPIGEWWEELGITHPTTTVDLKLCYQYMYQKDFCAVFTFVLFS